MIKRRKNSTKWKICTQLAFEISDILNFDKKEHSIKKVLCRNRKNRLV